MKHRLRDAFRRLKGTHPWIRTGSGSLLVVGGIFGFLPVLGFWMIPLGLILLAVDFHWARRMLVNLRLAGRRLRQSLYRHQTQNRRRSRGGGG
jgi:hypothetical protein